MIDGECAVRAVPKKSARDHLLTLFGFTHGLGSGNSKNATAPRAHNQRLLRDRRSMAAPERLHTVRSRVPAISKNSRN